MARGHRQEGAIRCWSLSLPCGRPRARDNVSDDVAVDFERCLAPCCTKFVTTGGADIHVSAAKLIQAVRAEWAPITLHVLSERAPTHGSHWAQFGCDASTPDGCSAYEIRPHACRVYDCRTDRFDAEDRPPPRCVRGPGVA